jgi:hypothetical protein
MQKFMQIFARAASSGTGTARLLRLCTYPLFGSEMCSQINALAENLGSAVRRIRRSMDAACLIGKLLAGGQESPIQQ